MSSGNNHKHSDSFELLDDELGDKLLKSLPEKQGAGLSCIDMIRELNENSNYGNTYVLNAHHTDPRKRENQEEDEEEKEEEKEDDENELITQDVLKDAKQKNLEFIILALPPFLPIPGIKIGHAILLKISEDTKTIEIIDPKGPWLSRSKKEVQQIMSSIKPEIKSQIKQFENTQNLEEFEYKITDQFSKYSKTIGSQLALGDHTCVRRCLVMISQQMEDQNKRITLHELKERIKYKTSIIPKASYISIGLSSTLASSLMLAGVVTAPHISLPIILLVCSVASGYLLYKNMKSHCQLPKFQRHKDQTIFLQNNTGEKETSATSDSHTNM